MSLIILENVEQRSDEWYAARLGIPTASSVGKLLTPTLKVASNDTARGYIASLVAERITGTVEPTFTSDDMMRGILHEPLARDRYAEANDVEVTEVGFMVRQEDGWTLGASPDGLVGDDGGVEIKCPRAKGHVLTILNDQVPSVYMAQLQGSLLVSGRKWWDYVSFCAGLPLYVTRVYPDPAWQEAITEACRAFETTARQMVADYDALAPTMPATERVADFDDISL